MLCSNSLITISPCSSLYKMWWQIVNILLSKIHSSFRAVLSTVSNVLGRPMLSSSWLSDRRFSTFPCQTLTCGDLSTTSTYIFLTCRWIQLKYKGRTESHEQLFFAWELGTADEGECGGRWNQLLCYPWVSCDVNSLHHMTSITPNKMADNDMSFRQRAVI